MLSTTFAPTKPKKNIKINIPINSLILKKSTAKKKIITKPSKTYFINFYFLKKKKKIKIYNNNKFQRKQNQNHRK